MPAALSGVPEEFGRRLGLLSMARAAALRRTRRDPVPAQVAVLPVAIDYRACPCGGWVASVTAEGRATQRVHAADVAEAGYAVQYQLDLIMSETGCDLLPAHTFGDDLPPPC